MKLKIHENQVIISFNANCIDLTISLSLSVFKYKTILSNLSRKINYSSSIITSDNRNSNWWMKMFKWIDSWNCFSTVVFPHSLWINIKRHWNKHEKESKTTEEITEQWWIFRQSIYFYFFVFVRWVSFVCLVFVFVICWNDDFIVIIHFVIFAYRKYRKGINIITFTFIFKQI